MANRDLTTGGSEGLSNDKMAAIIVGVVLAIILLAIVLILFVRHSGYSGTRNSADPITNLDFAYSCPGVCSPVKTRQT